MASHTCCLRLIDMLSQLCVVSNHTILNSASSATHEFDVRASTPDLSIDRWILFAPAKKQGSQQEGPDLSGRGLAPSGSAWR